MVIWEEEWVMVWDLIWVVEWVMIWVVAWVVVWVMVWVGADYGYTDMPYGSGMGGMGYGMGGDCCPRKKIWGSMNQKMDGMYVNVGKMPWGKLPRRCNSDCVYERMDSYDGLKYCFGDSMYSQSECDADMGDGEEPVDMGPGSGDMGSGYGEGSGYGDGSDGESPVDMGPGGESGM